MFLPCKSLVEHRCAQQLAKGGDVRLMHPRAPMGSPDLAKPVISNLIGPLECDGFKVHAVTFQVLPPLLKHFLQALYQMEDLRPASSHIIKAPPLSKVSDEHTLSIVLLFGFPV